MAEQKGPGNKDHGNTPSRLMLTDVSEPEVAAPSKKVELSAEALIYLKQIRDKLTKLKEALGGLSEEEQVLVDLIDTEIKMGVGLTVTATESALKEIQKKAEWLKEHYKSNAGIKNPAEGLLAELKKVVGGKAATESDADESVLGNFDGVKWDRAVLSAKDTRIEYLDGTIDKVQLGEVFGFRGVVGDRVKVNGATTGKDGWIMRSDLVKAAGAPDYFSKQIVQNAKDGRYYRARANAWQTRKEFDHALKDYDEAILLDANDALAYVGRCYVKYTKKEFVDAIEDCTRAIELDASIYEAYINRSMAYLIHGKNEESVADAEKAIFMSPQSAEPYCLKGHGLGRLGEYEKAIVQFEKALERDPGNVECLRERGVNYAKMKDYEKAIRDFNDILRLDPENAGVYNDRGVTYEEMGQIERAEADYNKADALGFKPKG